MRVLIQRVNHASVTIEGKQYASINDGIVILVGFRKEDTDKVLNPLIQKILNINYFADKNEKLVYSLQEKNASILIVSQFTLFADVKKGRKPSWHRAMTPDSAEIMYNDFVNNLKKEYPLVKTGIFGKYMEVNITNDGPFTLLLDTEELFPNNL